MEILSIDALTQAPVRREPFDHVIAEGLLKPETKGALQRDFPQIRQPGSFPLSELSYGPAFATLLEELRRPEFGAALADKLGEHLQNFPTVITVRGRCRARDGQVHTDAKWKIVSALLYLNDEWQNDGGNLRLLRSERVDDAAVEVPARWGMFLAFRRSERSFHGHTSFEGQRRVVQISWCTDQAAIDREQSRHRRSARFKRWLGAFRTEGY